MILIADTQGLATTAGLVASSTTIALDHAARWRLVIHNTHATNSITAIRCRFRTHAAAPWSPWESVTGTIAAGATLTVQPGVPDCSQAMQVELTADGASTGVALWLAGGA